MDSIKKTAVERMQALTDKAKIRLNADSLHKKSPLSAIKDEEAFFMADIFETVTYRDDLASMEYPIFALKAGDTRARQYDHDGLRITIRPTADIGLATIHDKDFWIYCISKMCQAMYEGEEICRTVRFTVYDFLKSTNRATGGINYKRTIDSLERLKGTSITIESDNKQERFARGFGLIDSWTIIEEKNGRMTNGEVTLPEWLYKSIQTKQVLTISPDYFRLRKPLDRRIYELARKHCGYQAEFKISLDILRKKSGTTRDLRRFRADIKLLANSDGLPDYAMQYDDKKDMVTFTNRNKKIQEHAKNAKTKSTLKKLIKPF